MPGKLVILLLVESIRIVVVREDDDGLIRDAGVLQRLQEKLQTALKLLIAGDVRLDGVGIRQTVGDGAVLALMGLSQLY